jgi:chaperone modulatory protein CbpM
MLEDDILIAACVEERYFTLDQLARTCAVSREWVLVRVGEGLLGDVAADVASEAGEWRFSAADRARARRMHALERDFDADPALAALTADLMEEIDRLQARLRRAGLE